MTDSKLQGARNALRATSYLVSSVVLTACIVPVSEAGDIDVTEQAIDDPSALVISQVYGGAGQSGATYAADYVEIFNRSDAAVTLEGHYLMLAAVDANFTTSFYAFSAGDGELLPGRYWLIKTNGSGSPTLPVTPDRVISDVNIDGSAGKLALIKWNGNYDCGSASLPCTEAKLAEIRDVVGYGAASFSEGGVPVGALSQTTAARRKLGGCTDANSNGEDFDIGTPTPRNSASPLHPCPPDTDMFVRTSSTGSTTCVVNSGQAMCWGVNTNGKLGQGNTNNYGAGVSGFGLVDLDLIDVGPDRTILDLTVGNSFVCARLDDNSLKCWGNTTYIGLGGVGGHRGDGANEMGDNLLAVDLAGNTTMLGQAGGTHVCVRTDAAGAPLKCFGSNSAAQVGWGNPPAGVYTALGDVAGETGDGNPSVPTGGVAGTTVVASAGGGVHNCVITSDNKVRCWGENLNGQLGRQSNVTPWGDTSMEMDALHEVFVGTGRYAIAITAGAAHTCVIRDDHSVICWGLNASGQLGRNTSGGAIGDAAGELDGDADLVAVTLGTGRSAVAITAGDHHTCALLDNGSVTCWGANGSGQLGRGVPPGNTAAGGTPVILGGRSAISIAGGASYTCAVLDDFTVRCWGSNAAGALGYDLNAVTPNNAIGDTTAEMNALGTTYLGTTYTVDLIF